MVVGCADWEGAVVAGKSSKTVAFIFVALPVAATKQIVVLWTPGTVYVHDT